MPTLVSLQAGKPALHGTDKPWQSGIFKYPVEGKVWLDSLNLEGDGQDDLENHGGIFRAVLGYSADHYPRWKNELERELPYGAFGENFTVSELNEETVCLGDIYTVGEAVVQVSQVRYPCWKLARRNDIKDLAARVEATGKGGWYHRVLQTGYVQTGDAYTLKERIYPQFPIIRLMNLVTKREINPDACAELTTIEALSPQWRELFHKFI